MPILGIVYTVITLASLVFALWTHRKSKRQVRVNKALLAERKLLSEQLGNLGELMKDRPGQRGKPEMKLIMSRNYLTRIREWAAV